ncbi:hypothetical protein C8J57DRAFT_1530879 [Mycena rebaudengoi]|nr:hypothetical protein C8J57DRAFT_1530879 [Mycena rebaudengoi]
MSSTSSQLEKLVGMVETLLLDNQELKQATRELKEDNQELQDRRNAANDSADSCEVIDPALLDDASSVATDAGVPDCDPASNMGEGDDIDLSTKERSTVQAYVMKVFRRYCNVGGNDWPDPNLIRTNPITHESYLTPFFHFDVQDLRNAKIIHEVATKIEMNSVWQTVLKRTAKSAQMPNWDLEFFVEMAKKSFRSLKRGWLRENDPNSAVKAEANARAHRRSQHHIHTWGISEFIFDHFLLVHLRQRFVPEVDEQGGCMQG